MTAVVLVGCRFGGTHHGAAADGGLAQGDATTDTLGSGDAAGTVTGIPTGGVGGTTGAGVSTTNAVDEPGTLSDDGETRPDTMATASGSTGDDAGSGGTADPSEESGSSDGGPVEDPYAPCSEALAECYGGQGVCYDSLVASVCVPYCSMGDCPEPLSGRSKPECSDFGVGMDVCGLPCDRGASECPTDMVCDAIPLLGINRCVWQ